jgi:tetraacyldisaccharide 4'-kinase
LNPKFVAWVEQYLFFPNWYQKLISIALLPLTMIYCIVVALKRINAKPINFGIPVISVGNLIVGGSGKTPITISLAKDYEDVFIVLRGYKRQTSGLQIVSLKGDIKLDVKDAGDEAILLAQNLPNASVIVSEDRKEAIIKAKELGAKIVFLDDGFSKVDIYKYDILLRPKIEPTNIFCLPSGGYRDTKMLYSSADLVLKDGTDFERKVWFSKDGDEIKELPKDITLLTSISKPSRLKEFLGDIEMIAYEDHHSFTKDEVDQIKSKAIIVTRKDKVKLDVLNIQKDIYIMELDINYLNEQIKGKIKNYYESYHH